MARTAGDLRGLLSGHGVPEKGIRIYLAASHGGPQTASELARVTTMHRVEAYRFVQQLIAQGLLTETGGRPKRFAALPPEALVDRWIREAAERLKRLERDRDAIVQSWQEARDLLDPNDGRKFSALEGRSAIHRFLGKRIGVAERQILLTFGGPTLASFLDGGVDRALREASERGVRIRVLTDIHRPHLAEAKHFLGFAELRHTSTPLTQRSIVFDRTGALVFVSGEGDPQRGSTDAEVAVWSTAPAVIDGSREYHQRLWGPALRGEHRVVEIEAPNMTVLPVVRGRERESFRRMREIASLGMQATGTRELRLSVPTFVEGIAEQLGQQIADEIDGSTPAELATALQRYYGARTPARLEITREKPLTLRISECFACTDGSTEIGRVLCPRVLRSIFEHRLGGRWGVTRPDPTRHATRGCSFTVKAG